MKTKIWVLTLAASAVLMGTFGFFLLQHTSPGVAAEIYSRGTLIKTIDLRYDQEFKIPAERGGYNLITVKSGRIAVTSASCPDHCCIRQGFCNSGAPIICLPNALEIRFPNPSGPDLSIG